MPATELRWWRAYTRVVGPLGPERDDARAALVAMVVASVNRKRGSRKPKLADFLLKWERGRPRDLSTDDDPPDVDEGQ